MKSTPTVSINLCCYNSEKYLRETLQSIVNQTYKDWELVIINDGSSDSTESIITEYKNKGYPIIYHYQTNMGLAASRNKALDLSQGKYIAFIDHDDIWLPKKLEEQINVMGNGCYALCYGGVTYIDKNSKEIGRRIPKNKSGFLFDRFLEKYDTDLPTVMIRKSMLGDGNLAFDENIVASEDYCLFMQIAANHEIAVINKILAKYRIHDNSLTNKSIDKWADEWGYTLDIICKRNDGIREKYDHGFKKAYAKLRYYRARCFVSRGEKFRAIQELRKNVFIDWRYLVLFLFLLCFPVSLWNVLHRAKFKMTRLFCLLY